MARTLLVALLVWVPAAFVVADDSLVGKKVFFKYFSAAFDEDGNLFHRSLLNSPETVIAVEGDRVHFRRARMLRDDVLLPEAALKHYTDLLKQDPSSKSLLILRGSVHVFNKDYERAIEDYSASIRIDPPDSASFANRGLVYQYMKQYEAAAADFRKAVAIDERDPLALNNLAWLQATCPDERFRDGKAAVENATRADKIQEGKSWYEKATLSAAYAEAGDFPLAIESAQKLPALASGDEQRETAAELLTLFQQSKPYRIPADE